MKPGVKPRLLFFVTEDWFFCSHFMARAVAARDAGFEVLVLTRERKHGAIIRNAGIRLFPLELSRGSINPFRELGVLRQVCQVYRRERPDIVHHVALKPVIYGSLAARMVRIKSVINAPVGMGYVFSSSSMKAGLLRPPVRLLLRLCLNPRGSKVVFENSDDLKSHVTGGAVRPEDAILIRGAGVDIAAFHPVEEPAGVPVVTLAARMLRDKGIVEFVEAARLLRERGVQVRCRLVGAPDDSNPASLPEATLKGWHEEGLIEWMGHSDDMPAVLASTHIACLPSYREGLPKSLLEALACGLPIVTTDVPGCRETVTDQLNGLLVPARDSIRLANAIEVLVRDKSTRRRFGEQSRLRAEREFSDEIVVAATLGLYAAQVPH